MGTESDMFPDHFTVNSPFVINTTPCAHVTLRVLLAVNIMFHCF